MRFFNNKSLNVYRTKTFDIKKLSIGGWLPSCLVIPDRYWIWYFNSIPIIKKLSTKNYRFILSSSPVQTAHVVALNLKFLSGFPWVCDFRDPWFWSKKTENCPWYQLALEKWLEKKVVKTADIVTVTNDKFKDYLSREYNKHVHTIANGFLPEDFEGLISHKTKNGRKIFIHAGSLYGRYRDPTPLLKAISDLKAQGKLSAENFLLKLIGGGDTLYTESFLRKLRDLDISDTVIIREKLPHKETLMQLMTADCLVLLQCDPTLQYQVPAKIYEYLRCKKPVLGIVAEGATDEILQAINPAWSIRPENHDGIQVYIRKIIQEDQAVLSLPDDKVIAGYSRSLQGEKLVELTRRF
jgi:glycosyltransferase involved in cell wall biosynthesis